MIKIINKHIYKLVFWVWVVFSLLQLWFNPNLTSAQHIVLGVGFALTGIGLILDYTIRFIKWLS